MDYVLHCGVDNLIIVHEGKCYTAMDDGKVYSLQMQAESAN